MSFILLGGENRLTADDIAGSRFNRTPVRLRWTRTADVLEILPCTFRPLRRRTGFAPAVPGCSAYGQQSSLELPWAWEYFSSLTSGYLLTRCARRW